MDLEELFRYCNKGVYFYLEQRGRAPKKPTTEQEREFQTERMARLKKLYGEEVDGDSS